MYLPTLTPPLLYALLSVNPAAVNSLRGSTAGAVSRRQIADPTPALVNAVVTCRQGEFQNPDSDIASVVCGDYYRCGGGTEAEQTEAAGQGIEAVAFTAQCFDCESGQPPERASGCVYTQL